MPGELSPGHGDIRLEREDVPFLWTGPQVASVLGQCARPTLPLVSKGAGSASLVSMTGSSLLVMPRKLVLGAESPSIVRKFLPGVSVYRNCGSLVRANRETTKIRNDMCSVRMSPFLSCRFLHRDDRAENVSGRSLQEPSLWIHSI